MLLLVGLGNPGREYEGSRHNLGFMAVDALCRAEKWPEFKSKFSGLWTRGELAGQSMVVLKPQTYMNLSGESVQPAAAFFKVAPKDIVVLHDELDLPWRDVRLKFGGGHAGNNGVRSLIDRLGTPDFARVRMGIGKPPAGFRGQAADWVLSNLDPIERAELPGVIDEALAAVRSVAESGLSAAMNRVNTRDKGAKG
ncbi:MAG: aminoacyl-tRNA hydrolase [Polyangiaceae bacterium]|nr:aminoacyl-tRNA hydrolase [Polyangiaceae bacterium]